MQLSLLSAPTAPPTPAPDPKPVSTPPSQPARRRWTLSPWIDDGQGLLRYWLPREVCRPVRVAACVEPDDRSDGWTIEVRSPIGEGQDASVWWSGGVSGRTLKPVPHAETLEEGQERADWTLRRMAARL